MDEDSRFWRALVHVTASHVNPDMECEDPASRIATQDSGGARIWPPHPPATYLLIFSEESSMKRLMSSSVRSGRMMHEW